MALTIRTANDLAGGYGSTYRHGILSEHLYLAERAGIPVRVSASGRRMYAIAPDGEHIPVLCSELVEFATEDGLVTGRCGDFASDLEVGACDGHAMEIRSYRSDSVLY